MAGGMEVFMIVWTNANGQWGRHMVRECPHCLTTRLEPLVYVDLDSLFCLHCLSDLLEDVPGKPWLLRCQSCGQATHLDDLQPEEPNQAPDDLEEDGWDPDE